MVQASLRVTTTAIFLWTAAISPAAAADSGDTQYTVDSQSSVVNFTLSARKSIFTVHRQGQFSALAGGVSYDPSNPSATRVDLTVYTGSVTLEDPEHEDLLRSDEFFDVAQHPTMHFVSTTVAQQGNGRLSVTGDLTIRGITRQLTLPIRVIPSAGEAGMTTFDTTFEIDRTQFGLNGGGPRSREIKVSIGKKVEIHMAITAHKLPPE